MRKLLFKKILSILDVIEIKGISLEEAPTHLYEAMANESFTLKMSEAKDTILYLKEKNILKESKNGMDLTSTATIYAKSNQNSGVEALSIFEMFILDTNIHEFYKQQMKVNEFIDKQEALRYIDQESLDSMLQTVLFEVIQEKLRFHPHLVKGIRDILDEYAETHPPLISVSLTALYTSKIVAHEDLRIDYKNTKLEMIDYDLKKVILAILPRRGIPHDRDETKALQTFYKDTLFHEFDHACPICGINIAHMLIASHIKPFRDCAHIFEAIDHNNGLLLCRNHDYLFDQGYYTFNDDGYLIISQDLLHRNHFQAFHLAKNLRLNAIYLTKTRRLFLQYHREHIFKK